MKPSFVVLVVMDGWGIAPDSAGNAITRGDAENIKQLLAGYPHTTLRASGEAVGLPSGQVGNTETGHLNLGAGRIVYQDLLRIDMAIKNNRFFENEVLLGAIKHAKDNNSSLHLMGLVGAGNNHSSISHLYSLLKLCKNSGFARVLIHVFTDGRDSPPKLGIDYIKEIEKFTKQEAVGKIVSVIGRYWAMDRDLRWDRTKVAYEALTGGIGRKVTSITEAVEESYDSGKTDEFINPLILAEGGQTPYLIKENDSVIFFNFRIDRPRQLTKAFVLDNFEKDAERFSSFDPYVERYYHNHGFVVAKIPPFHRAGKLKNIYFVTMTEYDKALNPFLHVAFPPDVIDLPLGEVLSNRNLRQLRVAESEKERFVTFYFNGQRELAFPGESRIIVSSPHVPTYDKKPEMSAHEIGDAILRTMQEEAQYSFILVNFANPDMVGHTGNIEAAKKAIKTVDEEVGRITRNALSMGGVTLVTADHGNAEEMIVDGKESTEHSANPVPFIIVGKDYIGKSYTFESGILGDVAPTILKIMQIPQPSEMTGRSLI